jgi:hypothetical protein
MTLQADCRRLGRFLIPYSPGIARRERLSNRAPIDSPGKIVINYIN